MTAKAVPIHAIAERVRRALRNRTGCTLSFDQIIALTHAGVLDLLGKHEIEELLRPKGNSENG